MNVGAKLYIKKQKLGEHCKIIQFTPGMKGQFDTNKSLTSIDHSVNQRGEY